MSLHRHPRPAFLHGTYSWIHRGYSFAESPPLDLLSPQALDADDPWIRMTAVLQRARHGDHSQIHRLAEWSRDSAEGHERAPLELIGHAGRDADLSMLAWTLLHGPEDAAANAARAASMSGRLGLVPPMLAAWKRAHHRIPHEIIGGALSDLLDEEVAGPLFEHAGDDLPDAAALAALPPESRSRWQARAAESPGGTAFEQEVERRLQDVGARFDLGLSFWKGRPFSVRRLAEDMLARVRRQPQSAGGLAGLSGMRQKFEAATGIDCSSFYAQGASPRVIEPQRDRIAAVLESFLAGGTAPFRGEGVRYFFGHRIPD